MRFAAPILVTGSIRSGTTWLGRLLATARNAFYVHEPFNPNAAWNTAFPTPLAHYYLDAHNGPVHAHFMARVLALEPDVKGRWKEPTAAPLFDEIDRFRRHRKRGTPVTVVLKDPTALYSCEWLADAFGCRPLLLLRHPVGVIRSLLRLGWARNLSWLAISGQPLLAERLRALDAGFEPFFDPAGWQELDDLERATRFVDFNCRFVLAMQRQHPEWRVLRYERLAADRGRLLALFDELELTPTDATTRALDGADPLVAPAGAQPRSLRPSPVSIDALYDGDDGIDWRRHYRRHFSYLAEAFPDSRVLALP